MDAAWGSVILLGIIQIVAVGFFFGKLSEGQKQHSKSIDEIKSAMCKNIAACPGQFVKIDQRFEKDENKLEEHESRLSKVESTTNLLKPTE